MGISSALWSVKMYFLDFYLFEGIDIELVEIEIAKGQGPVPDVEFLEILYRWHYLPRILIHSAIREQSL